MFFPLFPNHSQHGRLVSSKGGRCTQQAGRCAAMGTSWGPLLLLTSDTVCGGAFPWSWDAPVSWHVEGFSSAFLQASTCSVICKLLEPCPSEFLWEHCIGVIANRLGGEALQAHVLQLLLGLSEQASSAVRKALDLTVG